MTRYSQALAVLASVFLTLAQEGSAHPGGHSNKRSALAAAVQVPIGDPELTINSIPFTTRAHWMRQANIALGAPCPFAAFGTVIVNHTGSTGLGQVVCTGANNNSRTGNPTLHGEIAAINHCSAILTDPTGPYRLTPAAALAAFADFSLYTNAESCPMCAAAIRWAGFKEYIYGTSIDTLIEKGWGQIRIGSAEIVAQSFDLPRPTRLMGGVLANETDPFFLWQFDPAFACPGGCGRTGGSCKAV
ncbi:guanine deaminase [Podospora didyma]|uniref:Guanine deaminase n=1 Tax=Podospora didyma TaxID=330526 RepID=A0AAE0U532_9PEZI|nr:guanine deaminase [Podospora didyma]